MRTFWTALLLSVSVHTVTVLAQVNAPPQPSEDRDTDRTELDIPRSSDPGKQSPVRTFWHDEYRMWTSPFRPSERKLIKYEIPFAALVAGMIATDRATSKVLPNTTDQTTWSRRVTHIGAPYSLAGYSAAMYLVSRKTGDKRERETGWLSLITVAHTQLMGEVVKLATNRERPYKTGGHGGFFDGGDSFPSGHCAGSFGVATIFAYEYKEKRWVPFTAYGLATVVAASRISGQNHYLSDVAVGSAMGYLIGRYVYKQHHDPGVTGEKHAALLSPNIGFVSMVPVSARREWYAPAHGVRATWTF